MTATVLAFPGTTGTVESPLFRATREAIDLRRRYALNEGELEVLLTRWRALQSVPLLTREIKLAARAAALEVSLQPVTRDEASALLKETVDAFVTTPSDGEAALRAWCDSRPLVSAEQREALVRGYRRRVQRATESDDAA